MRVNMVNKAKITRTLFLLDSFRSDNTSARKAKVTSAPEDCGHVLGTNGVLMLLLGVLIFPSQLAPDLSNPMISYIEESEISILMEIDSLATNHGREVVCNNEPPLLDDS